MFLRPEGIKRSRARYVATRFELKRDCMWSGVVSRATIGCRSIARQHAGHSGERTHRGPSRSRCTARPSARCPCAARSGCRSPSTRQILPGCSTCGPDLEHMSPWQVFLPLQMVPHAPQFIDSVWRVTEAFEHSLHERSSAQRRRLRDVRRYRFGELEFSWDERKALQNARRRPRPLGNRGAVYSGGPFTSGRLLLVVHAGRERRYNSHHQRPPADAVRAGRVRSRCVKNTNSSMDDRTPTLFGSASGDARSYSDGGRPRRQTFACCRTMSLASSRTLRVRSRRCGSL